MDELVFLRGQRGGPEELAINSDAVLVGSANTPKSADFRYKGGKSKSKLLAQLQS